MRSHVYLQGEEVGCKQQQLLRTCGVVSCQKQNCLWSHSARGVSVRKA
jgi:hypothetical protein